FHCFSLQADMHTHPVHQQTARRFVSFHCRATCTHTRSTNGQRGDSFHFIAFHCRPTCTHTTAGETANRVCISTPKALHNKAQGCERSGLPWVRSPFLRFNAEGVAQG